ncbi:MAG: hypothetical protein ACLU33_00220 [Christensenellales bacterium]
MSIETDLMKDGIKVIEPLDRSSVISIAQNVSKELFSAFPNYGFTYEDLFEKFSNVPMYVAEIPNGMAEASYFYKNSSIYFRDGMGLNDLEKFSVHELIHHLQVQKDKNGNLYRLGLCEFNGSKIHGMALNEAAVQIIASNTLNSTFENVEYYGITFSTISPQVYPLICNLVTQMAYVTGEDILFESTFKSSDKFKNKFSALCGSKNYNTIVNNLDKILNTEEAIIKISNKLESSDLKDNKIEKLTKKVADLKTEIKTLFLSTQELIITSYFNTLYSSILTTDDIDSFRKKLYSFQELIGSTHSYYFFNIFYINMMEKLDTKYEAIVNNTYLITKKENKLTKVINFIRKLILKKEFENNN